jgi:hypothetical protein
MRIQHSHSGTQDESRSKEWRWCWATPSSSRTPYWRKGELLSDQRLSRPLEGEREHSVDTGALARHTNRLAETRLSRGHQAEARSHLNARLR